jgi:hypothetical protein
MLAPDDGTAARGDEAAKAAREKKNKAARQMMAAPAPSTKLNLPKQAGAGGGGRLKKAPTESATGDAEKDANAPSEFRCAINSHVMKVREPLESR